MGSDSPLVKHNVYNIDTGGGFNKGRLTAYEINSDTYIQSSPVELYPEEEEEQYKKTQALRLGFFDFINRI